MTAIYLNPKRFLQVVCLAALSCYPPNLYGIAPSSALYKKSLHFV